VSAPYSCRWSRIVGRAYWLPPWGVGNGLDAETWAVIADVPQSDVQFILDALREAGIPAHAACRAWHDREAPFRMWVGTWYYSRAEDVIGRALLRMQRGQGRASC
jgi:hypothetical protein